jgi:ABC-2 type transport system permease protein
MSESLHADRVASTTMARTRPFYWSVRRELWENRFVYIAPIAVAGVFLIGFLINASRLPSKMRGVAALDPAHYRHAIVTPYDFAAGLMMLTTILVSVFYCVDALHSERRDRSILFWKSLPVSDATTVLAKATIPLIIVPLLTFVLAAGMQLFMMLVSSVVLLGSGLRVAPLWSQLPFFEMSALLLYHLLTAHTLWPAPIYAWFLLVSGSARRAAFLWAVLPLVAIAGLEMIVFHTSHFAMLVMHRFIGANSPADMGPPGVFPTNPMAHLMPARLLMSPGLWIGLAITAIFLYAAVRLRRSRAPI